MQVDVGSPQSLWGSRAFSNSCSFVHVVSAHEGTEIIVEFPITKESTRKHDRIYYTNGLPCCSSVAYSCMVICSGGPIPIPNIRYCRYSLIRWWYRYLQAESVCFDTCARRTHSLAHAYCPRFQPLNLSIFPETCCFWLCNGIWWW